MHLDIDPFDLPPAPYALEKRVAEPEDKQVLYGFLAEIVVDAKYLGFGEILVYEVVQRMGRRQIVSERLFDDEPCPACCLVEIGLPEGFDGSGERLWGQGKIKDPVSGQAAFFFDGGNPAGKSVVAVASIPQRLVEHVIVAPGREIGALRMLLVQRLPDAVPEGCVRHIGPGHAKYVATTQFVMPLHEMKQGGHQLA